MYKYHSHTQKMYINQFNQLAQNTRVISHTLQSWQKLFFFCLTLGQTGTGVLSNPWLLCLSHHFFVILYITCQILFWYPLQRSCRGVYWFHHVRPSVRPSVCRQILCRMITWVVFLRMFWNFISSLPVKRGGSLSLLVGIISNVLVMEIGWTDVGSGGYILVSCAHSNTSLYRTECKITYNHNH